MKVIMRLYKQHDLDLIYLYKTKGFSFQKNMKAVLNAYVNNKQYKVQIPNEITNEDVPRFVQLHICLSEQEDTNIINWINNLKKGYKNNALKNLFRNYMATPVMCPYNIKSDDIKKVDENIDVKKMVNDILETPTSEDKDNVVLEEHKTVLKEKNENKESIIQEENNTQENNDDFDFFGEFDSMIGDFKN